MSNAAWQRKVKAWAGKYFMREALSEKVKHFAFE
jgi:hypothetical protein